MSFAGLKLRLAADFTLARQPTQTGNLLPPLHCNNIVITPQRHYSTTITWLEEHWLYLLLREKSQMESSQTSNGPELGDHERELLVRKDWRRSQAALAVWEW